MRRFLFIITKSLSAWPLLCLLMFAIGTLHWLGMEADRQAVQVDRLLEETVRLKQKKSREEALLNGLALNDLRRRSLLYAEAFLLENADTEEFIRSDLNAVFDAVNWSLEDVTIDQLVNANGTIPIGAVSAVLSASMPVMPDQVVAGQPYLPVQAAVDLGHQIWRVPPYKEIESIRLERTIDGYRMSMGLFLPCQKQISVAEISIEESADAETIQ